MFLRISWVRVLRFSSGVRTQRGQSCQPPAITKPLVSLNSGLSPPLLLEGCFGCSPRTGFEKCVRSAPWSPSPQLPSQSLLSVTGSGGSQVL